MNEQVQVTPVQGLHILTFIYPAALLVSWHGCFGGATREKNCQLAKIAVLSFPSVPNS